MTAMLQEKVLFVALVGMFGAAHAVEPPTQPSTSTTKISNNLSNTYSNTNVSLTGTAYLEGIAVYEVFDPKADAMASAQVNDVQKNLGNKLNVTDPTNASVSGSVSNIQGNAGVNNASGFFNQQANNVAISSASGKSSGAVASTSFEQMNDGNSYTFAQPMPGTSNQMGASISNSLNNIQGNAGVNNAAGAGNQQKNDVALASASSAVLATASAGGMQVNQGTSVTTFFPLNGSASLTGSVNGISGNVGLNNAAGLSNQQVNSLSVAATH
ncbi:hypothetical protein EAY64_12005 [Aquitalea palustris]|uniref:Cell surface protein n=1 Tax=Aquitalea palustris TaxID=2480983 RepID=A0A454JHD9_9NEIS|nr:hypothetical protein [Aquitalea palustris]RMC96531.1 hypothetical protein EAY64_12005 [Aquitalea palustris]